MKFRELIEKLNGEHNVSTLGKEVKIGEKKLRKALKDIGAVFDNSSKKWLYEGDENVLEREITEFVDMSTNMRRKREPMNRKVQKSSLENKNEQESSLNDIGFTDDEIEVLKSVVEERKRGYELFSKYRIYDELSKVPTDEDVERSAYNISKSTVSRLKKYAKDRRLPLQDLVELAIINLLEKYDKEK